MDKSKFPEGFLWGASTSDYQIEGGNDGYGKGETYWDRFAGNPGRIMNNDRADVACDHYHRYEEDIKLMKEIGLKAYRMSISWARVFPEGKGAPNRTGIDFYKRLLVSLLENGIKPVVTLHHWGFPQKLQDIGGWANRDVADYYQHYVTYVFKELGDMVNTWITHNEPIGTSYFGYFTGEHAPGVRDFSTSILVTHNILLSHGKAVEAFRQMGLKGEIGTTLNFHPAYPLTEQNEDIAAADRIDAYFNGWFQEAIFKGRFPALLAEFLQKKGVIIPQVNAKDFQLISQPLDFLGINYYYPHFVSYNPLNWPFEADFKPFRTGKPRTSPGWEIFPQGLYRTLTGLKRDFGNIKIYITENGSSFNDIVDRNGKVEDLQRIDFLHRHIEQVHRCILEGVNVQGYFVWSLMDNFEWNAGYSERFGLIYIDYETLARKIKSSGYWYQNLIKNNSLS